MPIFTKGLAWVGDGSFILAITRVYDPLQCSSLLGIGARTSDWLGHSSLLAVIVAENKGRLWGTVVYVTVSRQRQNWIMQVRVRRERETEKNRRLESQGSGVRRLGEW